MKAKLFIAALFFSLISCNESKKEDNIATSKVELLTSLEENEEDTARKVTEAKADADEHVTSAPSGARGKSQPLLVARGSEPGWYAEFHADYAVLLLDYGKDSLKIDHDFSNINKDKTYTSNIVNVTNDNGKKSSLSLQINIENKSCTEMSGEKRDKTITLRYNNKEYKGCAETK